MLVLFNSRTDQLAVQPAQWIIRPCEEVIALLFDNLPNVRNHLKLWFLRRRYMTAHRQHSKPRWSLTASGFTQFKATATLGDIARGNDRGIAAVMSAVNWASRVPCANDVAVLFIDKCIRECDALPQSLPRSFFAAVIAVFPMYFNVTCHTTHAMPRSLPRAIPHSVAAA